MDSEWIRVRQEQSHCHLYRLHNCAIERDWAMMFAWLPERPETVNSWRPGDRTENALLHRIAQMGAPAEVAEQLVQRGASRLQRNARRETASDIAEQHGHHHLREALAPKYEHSVDLTALAELQTHFHELIRSRGRVEHERLPDLELLLEMKRPCAVVFFGMRFRYTLETEGPLPSLIVESWLSCVAGSAQVYEVTPSGSQFLKAGPG